MLVPLYSVLDRAAGARRPGPRTGVALAGRQHLRVPAFISGILLLVYFPLILGYSSKNYRNDTGHALAGYTRNWLLITAGVFCRIGARLRRTEHEASPSLTASRP